MASVFHTDSCSLYGMHIYSNDTKISILEAIESYKKETQRRWFPHPVKTIYCIITPPFEKIEPVLFDVGFKLLSEFPRSHNPDNARLYLRIEE